MGIQQLHPTQSGYTLQGSKVEWDLRCVCQTIHGFAMPLSMNPCQLHLGFVVWHVSLLHRRSSLGSFSWSSVGFGSLVEATTRLGPEKQLHRCNVFSKKNCTIDWLYSQRNCPHLPRWEEEQRLQVRFRIVVLEQVPRHCLLILL